MPKYKDMTAEQRRAYDAAYAGFYLGGTYDVSFGGHRRTIFADSVRWLAREVFDYLAEHRENHAEDHVTVRYLAAA